MKVGEEEEEKEEEQGEEEEEEEEEKKKKRGKAQHSYLNFLKAWAMYGLSELRWAFSPPNILLEAAYCKTLAMEPRFRRWSGIRPRSTDKSTMSKASGATMAGFM